MKRTLALPLVLVPGLATADVTPQDVWDNITATYAAMGITVDSNPTVQGDSLITNDTRLLMTFPLGAGGASVTFPALTLQAQGDGTVRITAPETYAMDFEADIPGEDEPVTATVTVSQKGMDAVASGDPRDVTYTTNVADFDLLVNNLVVAGEGDLGSIQLDSDGYQGVNRITQQANGSITLTSATLTRATKTTFELSVDGFEQTQTSDGGDLTLNAKVVLPPNMSILNLTPALRAGLSITGDSMAEGGTSGSTTLMEGQVMSEQSQTVGPSTTSFSLDQTGLRFDGKGDSVSAEILDQDLLPFPIAFSAEGFTFEFALPVVAEEAAQDFTYAFSLGALEIDGSLWDLIDPTQSLNRSPASLGLDVRGSLNWGLDLFDFAMYEALGITGEVPIEVNSVDIRNISVAALGAMAKATGDFTFDNDDLATIPGLPRPEGSAIVEASGVNAVMEQLMAAGLLTEADVSPARLMMGLFTRVTGDDSLETTVEVNAEGHVLVNGQRMR